MFADTLALIPYRATTEQSRGIVPVLMRLTTHFSHLVRDHENALVYPTTDIEDEMEAIRAHNDALLVNTPAISVDAFNHLINLQTLILRYTEEYQGWTDDSRNRFTQDTLHRIAAIGAFLDTELANIRDADAGNRI